FGQGPSSAAPPASAPFTFGGPTNNMTNTAPPAPSSGGGLVFPTGPTTPLTKTLELDSMDASPIRGGDSSSNVGSSFSAANTGGGFSFGASNTSGGGGFGSSTGNAFSSTNSGFGAPSTSGFGGLSKDAPSTPSSTPFSFGTPTSATSSFGQQPPASSFGQGGGGFSFSQPAAASASPFNQPQSLASPAVGGFAQLASPAASPFTQPISLGSGGSTFGGTPQGQKRLLSEDPSDGG
ncbi:14920_t:CDS:1, partial [Acaulospora colombiana]